MKKYTKLAVVSMLSGTLAACSSGDSNSVEAGTNTSGPVNDPINIVIGSDAGATDSGAAATDGAGTTDTAATDGAGTTDTAATDGTGTTDTAATDGTGTTDTAATDGTGTTDTAATDGTGTTDTAATDGTGTTDTAATDGTGTTDTATTGGTGTTDTAATDGTGTTDATSGEAGNLDTGSETTGGLDSGETEAGSTDDGVTDAGSTDGASEPNLTPNGRSELGNPPTLVDPFADAIPSPDGSDPFGFDLEIDSEVAIAGGAPTTPKNLRIDLISNDWSELNWAPSNDDVAVEEYRLYRSDGHIYTIREDQVGSGSGQRDEIAKIWSTTSFIDCNYTRFNDQVHFCDDNGPKPGDTFSYQITAVDGEGQESPLSNTISVTYHKASNAPVPKTDDFYKHPDDTFAQDHDLSDTAFFLDKFSLVFEDNFNGPEIDASKWQTSLTWGDTTIINGEKQYFVDTQSETEIDYDPFKFENGELIIEAIQTPDDVIDLLPEVCEEENPSGFEQCQFLSGALSSHDRFGMTYGYVEGRMKVGGTAGMLSSFYTYHRYTGTGKNLHGPEIDIVEYLGENPFGDEDAFQTYHFRDVTDGSIRSAPTMSYKNPTGELYADDYHTFGMLWEPQLVIWYIDGKEIKRLSGVQVGRQEMNIVTYLVAGSDWAPTPEDDDSIYPLQYKIDYIRAYQRPEYSSNGLYPE